MTDRELLELAAKAAGMTLGAWSDAAGAFMYRDGYPGRGYWNPLTDDGDALRLAVKLRLAIDIGIYLTSIDGPQEGQKEFVVEHHDGAALRAVRRAIVRAAAMLAKDR